MIEPEGSCDRDPAGYRAESNFLNRHPQLDSIVGRVDQILLRSEVPLGRLDTGVAKHHLDLLKFPAGGAA